MKDLTIFGRIDEDLEQTVQLFKKNNVSVVIRDEHELNCILISEAKESAVVTANTKCKGKGISTSSDKEKNWDEAVQKLKRLNATHLFRWGCLNKIVVHSPSWKLRIWIDTITFKTMMEKLFLQ